MKRCISGLKSSVAIVYILIVVVFYHFTDQFEGA